MGRVGRGAHAVPLASRGALVPEGRRLGMGGVGQPQPQPTQERAGIADRLHLNSDTTATKDGSSAPCGRSENDAREPQWSGPLLCTLE